jgi:hypothetical protein
VATDGGESGWRDLPNRACNLRLSPQVELHQELDRALANKGVAPGNQGNNASALIHFNEALTLLEGCVLRDGQMQFAGMLDTVTGWRDRVSGKLSMEHGFIYIRPDNPCSNLQAMGAVGETMKAQ